MIRRKQIYLILILIHIPLLYGVDDATLDSWILGEDSEKEKISWETELNLKFAAAYKDNVLLSPFTNQEGGAVITEFETFSWRFPQKDKADILWYILASNTHYPDIDDIENERLVIAQYSVDVPTATKYRFGGSIQYIYSDQVFEVGFNELNTEQTILESNHFEIRPFLSYSLAIKEKLKLEIPVRRNFFRDSIDDYTEPSVKLIYSKKYGFVSKFKGSYEFGRRFSDKKPLNDEDGFSISGTKENWKWHSVSAEFKHNWNKKKSLQTKSKINLRFNEDNGKGYDDFVRYRFSQKFLYKMKPWTLSATTAISRYRYPAQSAQLINLLDHSKRRRTDYNVNVVLERIINEKTKLFIQFTYRENDSNRSTEEYSANTVVFGLDIRI